MRPSVPGPGQGGGWGGHGREAEGVSGWSLADEDWLRWEVRREKLGPVVSMQWAGCWVWGLPPQPSRPRGWGGRAHEAESAPAGTPGSQFPACVFACRVCSRSRQEDLGSQLHGCGQDHRPQHIRNGPEGRMLLPSLTPPDPGKVLARGSGCL